MTSLLNTARPPAFCPGCGHDRVAKALDRALTGLGVAGHEVVIVSDIGCAGLMDIFFKTHAVHGLHGRALTYALGVGLVRPELRIVVIMGDGGLGIGGAHLVAACRRNQNMTLLVLNNFNYGMTGGQCSATTPRAAATASNFLGALEQPLDICAMASAAGAGHVQRCAAHHGELNDRLTEALSYTGFSLVDVWGACPGRYGRRNRISPTIIDEALAAMPAVSPAPRAGTDYGTGYRRHADQAPSPSPPVAITATHTTAAVGRREILLMGRAGQRIGTAAELICMAAMTAGRHASLKSDYPITVLRGYSVAEVILDTGPILDTGLHRPHQVAVLAEEGLGRRSALLSDLSDDALVVHDAALTLTPGPGQRVSVDFKRLGIHPADRALAAAAVLARLGRTITQAMLADACQHRFHGEQCDRVRAVLDTVYQAALSMDSTKE